MPSDTTVSVTRGDAAADVAALDRAARRLRTPCGGGAMVWRVWGAGEPLVLLHGGSGSWTHWFRNIPLLSRHYQLWVPDLPGLGSSAMPPEPWTPASVARAVAGGIDMLLARDARFRLAGFSFGGHVGTLLAAALGDRVREMVLIGVAALGLKAEPRERFAKERPGMNAHERAAVYRQNLQVLMLADAGTIDDLAIHLQAENIRRARFRSRPFAATDAVAQGLARVTAPLGTIWGTRDIIARPSLEARLAVLRRHHPELEVRLVEGAGHWVMYEAADAFNGALIDLLGASH